MGGEGRKVERALSAVKSLITFHSETSADSDGLKSRNSRWSPGLGKLWPTSQPLVLANKVLLGHTATSLVYISSVAAFTLQPQSWGLAMETRWSQSVPCFTLGKVCWPPEQQINVFRGLKTNAWRNNNKNMKIGWLFFLMSHTELFDTLNKVLALLW